MNRLLKAALIFGLAPLVLGFTIFALWLFTRTDWLAIAGILTICAGFGSFVIGAICLIVYVCQSLRSGEIPRRKLLRQTLGTTAVLLAFFPAAYGTFIAAAAIDAYYTVTLINETDQPLKDAHLSGGGVFIDFGDVGPGETVKRGFWIQCDGELVLTGFHGEKRISAVVDGYVTCNIGADKIVIFQPSGEVKVVLR